MALATSFKANVGSALPQRPSKRYVKSMQQKKKKKLIAHE